MKKTLALLMAVLFVLLPLSSCSKYEPIYDTLVIGTQDFEKKFNPFYADNAYDMQVLDQIFVAPQRINADNVLIDWAGSIRYEEKEMDDGSTHIVYTVKVNKGMKFTDGEPITIDDVIYSYYVYADPGYSGPSSSWALSTSIVGLKEYYFDDPNYTVAQEENEQTAKDKYSPEKISKEDFIAYLIESNLDGWWTGDPEGEAGADTTWSDYIKGEGYEKELSEIDAKNPDQMLALLAEIEYTNYAQYYDAYTYYLTKLNKEYIAGNLEDGVDVETISGIVRVDDYTCTVEFYEIDIYGDRSVNVSIVPEHYYGDFDKGKADDVLLKNLDKPMGSGPYIWVGFADNIVTTKANDDYFEGEPFIKNVKWQFIPDTDLIPSLIKGDIDIANPSASKDTIDELNSKQMHYTLVDNNGYGYLGINADNVEKNVRKGFMHLLSRGPSVKAYYVLDELATVIERPMTTTLAEYPDDAKEYYAYDKDKALQCFLDGGYEQVNGKLVKDGKQLKLTAYIGGGGIGDHPGYAMLAQAQTDVASLGGELIIQDVQFSVLQAAMDSGEADIFILAWGASNTCDKTTIYKTGAGQNSYNLSNARVDELLTEIVKTIDLKERKALVSEMLDLVMDEAVELPLYQRKNMLAYNPNIVDIDSLPKTSTYWTYENVLWKLKLN